MMLMVQTKEIQCPKCDSVQKENIHKYAMDSSEMEGSFLRKCQKCECEFIVEYEYRPFIKTYEKGALRIYSEQSTSVKQSVLHQIKSTIKDYFNRMVGELSIEQAEHFTFNQDVRDDLFNSFYNEHFNNYVVYVRSFDEYCDYPKDRLITQIEKYGLKYYQEIKDQTPSSAQLKYALNMQEDLNTSFPVNTENYYLFMAIFSTLLELHQPIKEQREKELQKEMEEENKRKQRSEPATEKQIIAIRNSFNYFSRGKQQLDEEALISLSKYDASQIFDLMDRGPYAERVARICAYLENSKTKSQ
ncbi:hypothetical protein [Solibacillus sp. NPDC093137]|uniref:hypothetical protein n=1 Tax=Solibacillus sp. NPDC093137 TaxID=3390678 RepID=UPI003D04C2CA